MPIRPENRKRYPKFWRAISDCIRFGRAGGMCECTGECGIDHGAAWHASEHIGERCAAVHGEPHPVTESRVVLTVAHLDHRPENCDPANLKAMCQRCHNRMDAPMRRAGQRARARAQAAISDLFDSGGAI